MADEGKVVIELVGKDSATQTFVKSFQNMESSIKKLEDSGSGLGRMGSAFNSIRNHWLSLSAAIGGGLSFAKFWSDFDKLATTESALLKMSKRLNDTVENISALGYVARKSGMDADAFNIALERMQKNVSNAAKGVSEAADLVDEFGEPVGKASKTLDELGLRAEVLNKLPLPQKLKEISSAMKDNVAPADQSRVALELFGKSGGGLVIPLGAGSEAIQGMLDRYKELGGVLTTDGATAMAAAKSATTDLSIAWNNFARELYENVSPAIAYTINQLTNLIVAAREARTANDDFKRSAGNNPLNADRWWLTETPMGGGGGGGGWGEDIRKTPSLKPPTKPSGGGGKGGGGGGSGLEAVEKSVRSFIDSMVQVTAQSAGDTEAILNAWKGKQLQTLNELATKGADIAQAKIALGQAVDAKQRKLDSDFADWYNTGLGNQYETLAAEERKKLMAVEGNETKIAQVREVYAHKYQDLEQQMETERVTLFKGYLDTMAGLTPVLADQLGYKRQALDYELKLADAALERSRREGKITPEVYEQAQAMQALAAQAKKFSLEMENNKGLQGWAYARVKSDSQTNTWADAMEGLEGFVNDAWTQGVQGALSKSKIDVIELAKTFALSAFLNLGTQGIHKLFGGIAEAIAGGPGKIGTDSNPMVVRIHGAGLSGLPKAGKGLEAGAAFERSAQRAGKIGYSISEGHDDSWSDQAKQLKTYEKLLDKMYKGEKKDLGGIQKLQERFIKDDLADLDAYGQMQEELIGKNEELFKADYLLDYQDSFTGMTTNMTGVWGVAQGLMTAAGVEGDTARLMSMGNFAMQGVGVVTKLAKGTILADASRGAAAAFAWMVELVPPPMGEILGAAAAAIAFGAISAYGMFGGETGGIASSAGGEWLVAATGPRITHQNETILPDWAAQGWRDIVSREASSGRGRSSGEGGGGGARVVYSPTYHIQAIDARGVKEILQKHGRTMAKTINRELGRRGKQL